MKNIDDKNDRHLSGRSRRCKCFSIIGVLALAIILAIVIPLAIIIPRNAHAIKGVKSTVLVPLYIYPSAGAWDPLYTVVTAHPEQNYTVILNPDSGPGASPYTSDEYMLSVKKLNAFSNVRTIGYVRTGFATRNISDVLADVAIYSGWNTNANATTGSSLSVHGIFFDEAPNEYTTANAQYMLTINQAVKSASGILADKTIIQNPGTIPDAGLIDPTTDFSVVFEGSYAEYNSKQTALVDLPLTRARYSYVIHSIPTTLSQGDVKKFAAKASQRSSLFSLTNNDVDFYQSFGAKWSSYIDVMPA